MLQWLNNDCNAEVTFAGGGRGQVGVEGGGGGGGNDGFSSSPRPPRSHGFN